MWAQHGHYPANIREVYGQYMVYGECTACVWFEFGNCMESRGEATSPALALRSLWEGVGQRRPGSHDWRKRRGDG